MKRLSILAPAFLSVLCLVAPATTLAQTADPAPRTNKPLPVDPMQDGSDRAKAATSGQAAPQVAPGTAANRGKPTKEQMTQVAPDNAAAKSAPSAPPQKVESAPPAALRGKPSKEQRSGVPPPDPPAVPGKPTKEQKSDVKS